MTAPALLTEEEAARAIGVAPRTLRALRSQGKIRYVRPSPRTIRYKLEDVTDYIANATCQDNPACQSTNQPKAVTSTTISNGKGGGIMDRLAARPGGMPKGLRLISGGKHP